MSIFVTPAGTARQRFGVLSTPAVAVSSFPEQLRAWARDQVALAPGSRYRMRARYLRVAGGYAIIWVAVVSPPPVPRG